MKKYIKNSIVFVTTLVIVALSGCSSIDCCIPPRDFYQFKNATEMTLLMEIHNKTEQTNTSPSYNYSDSIIIEAGQFSEVMRWNILTFSDSISIINNNIIIKKYYREDKGKTPYNEGFVKDETFQGNNYLYIYTFMPEDFE
jgi:hypothetical protein